MIYSQGQEQIWIEKLFGNYIGTFCDCGANDGITFSNTYQLHLNKWKGILIEPSLEAFRRLKSNYTNGEAKLFNVAATGLYEGAIKMYEGGEHIGNGDVSLLSTVHKEELKRWEGSNNDFFETDVDAMPINGILEEAGFKIIDFFSIDCEGSEIDILKQIDLNKYKTMAVCVEWNSKDKNLYDNIIIPQGFELLHQNAENLIYSKK